MLIRAHRNITFPVFRHSRRVFHFGGVQKRLYSLSTFPSERANRVVEQASMAEEAGNPKPAKDSPMTNEATIESNAPDCSDSSIKNPETSGISSSGAGEDHEKSLEFSDELKDKGNIAFKEGDYAEATELFSRALEIRVAHYGELAPECIHFYYKFGRALLNKAQEEADPFGVMPKKDTESRQSSAKVEPAKNNVEGESSMASVSSNAEQCASSNQQQGTNDVPNKSDQDKDEGSDMEEIDEAEGDESDLDLAWKTLDLARAISEKHSLETMDTVDILSALAEVSLEREEIETALSDYQKALSILERLVEPDSRDIVEINFRICLTLEVGSRAEEAIPYCQRAISLCKSRMQRLADEVKSMSGSTSTSVASEVDRGVNHSISTQSENSVSDKQAQIETLSSISSELDRKLEDLQQLVSNPKSILSDILGLATAKARANEQAVAAAASASGSCSRVGVANFNGDFDSPTVSTAHTNGTPGVTHLGVVGRGVKRVNMNSANAESGPGKKPAVDPKSDTGDSNAS